LIDGKRAKNPLIARKRAKKEVSREEKTNCHE